MTDKLDRFTKHARQVLQIAQEEATRLNHNYVGTEHLLLGLAKEENGLASKVLRELGTTSADVTRAVERMAPRNPRPPFSKPQPQSLFHNTTERLVLLSGTYLGFAQ
jgi:ATP-dependent Clp protease ATP-binding subunit ClpC